MCDFLYITSMHRLNAFREKIRDFKQKTYFTNKLLFLNTDVLSKLNVRGTQCWIYYTPRDPASICYIVTTPQ